MFVYMGVRGTYCKKLWGDNSVKCTHETFCFAPDTSKTLRQITICPPAGFHEDLYDKKPKMWKKALQCSIKGSISQVNTYSTQFKMCINRVVIA